MPENKPEINLTPNICYLGLISSGKNDTSFGVLQEDRRKHLYILGKTGMGKTTLLENMALQDIYNGYGLCF
jgi:DNA helicase HerA-like ATPase